MVMRFLLHLSSSSYFASLSNLHKKICIEEIKKATAEKGGNTKALHKLDKLNESLSKVQAICILGDEKHDAEKHDTLDYIIEGMEKVAADIAGTDD